MLFPAAKSKLVNRIDADKAKLERLGIRAALRIGTKARTQAYAAWRVTRDIGAVKQAVSDVLIGQPKLEQPGIVTLVRDSMVAAHLQGLRRTGLNLQAHVDEGIRLSSAYDGAIEFLKRRMELGPDAIATLQETYKGPALKVVETSTDALEQALQKAIVESTEAGEGVRGGIKALRQAFESEGFTPGKDYQLEAIFRTQTQQGYGAGRWQSLNDPLLGDLVKGYEYVAVHDDRTRPTHELMDGTRAAADDPVWNRWWPPCGWNCRCTTLEILGEFITTDIPNVDPDPGFGFNPGKVFALAA